MNVQIISWVSFPSKYLEKRMWYRRIFLKIILFKHIYLLFYSIKIGKISQLDLYFVTFDI